MDNRNKPLHNSRYFLNGTTADDQKYAEKLIRTKHRFIWLW